MAYTTCDFEGATASAIRPQGFAGRPLLLVSFISVQWSPPSVDSNSPLPGPPARKARTLLLSWGSMRILAMCSESFKPMLVQFSPPSVDLYMPSPIETLFLVQASPEPTQTI